jgi:hypothetical protein
MSSEDITAVPSSLLDALYGAHEFITSVIAWEGQEDDREAALTELDDAIAALTPPEGSEHHVS